MASLETSIERSAAGNLMPSLRRFIRWLSRPHVILSLIMLLLMYYMIIIPLYRMLETTLTWQMRDLIGVPGAELGGFTLFHYARMVTGELSKIYLYTPLQHSLTIATGATLLALVIGGTLAWLVIRTDMPGRKIVNQLALIPYIMPSWTLAQAWLVFFKNRLSGGTPGVFEYLVGQSPPDWLSYGPVPIIICSALHYYTFFFLFVSAALMSIDSSLEESSELMGASRWRDEMATAYQELYGKEWTEDEAYGDDTPNAGYLFLKKLARNQPGIQPGGDEVDAAFATLGMDPSVEPGYGWTGLSSYESTQDGELAMAPCYDLKPVAGILKATYLGIANEAPHPNAAKLFIKFALTEEGFAPWNEFGAYPSVEGLPIAEGMPPRDEIKLWPSDDLYAYQNLSKIRDFWAVNLLTP